MPSYIAPNKLRMNAQMRDNIMPFAGQTATWKQWISASSGVAVAGYGQVNHFRSQTITALFNAGMVAANTENQVAGGQLPSGMLQMTSRERVGFRDEILYNGFRYRIDADAQPSVMNGYYMTMIRRSLTGT